MKKLTQISLFLKLIFFCGRKFIDLLWNQQIPMDEYGEVRGEENYHRINSFPRSRKNFILLMSENWEYELLISINFQQHEFYKEHPARFKGE